MTKRNITVLGIVLILLIAIVLTIALGGSNGAPGAIGALQLRTLTLETLDPERASLTLPLLEESPVVPEYEKSVLKSELSYELKYELGREPKSLTVPVDGLTSRLGLTDHLLNLAPASGLRDNLHGLLPTA